MVVDQHQTVLPLWVFTWSNELPNAGIHYHFSLPSSEAGVPSVWRGQFTWYYYLPWTLLMLYCRDLFSMELGILPKHAILHKVQAIQPMTVYLPEWARTGFCLRLLIAYDSFSLRVFLIPVFLAILLKHLFVEWNSVCELSPPKTKQNRVVIWLYTRNSIRDVPISSYMRSWNPRSISNSSTLSHHHSVAPVHLVWSRSTTHQYIPRVSV